MIVYGEDSFEADPVRGLQECAAALERLRNDPSWHRFNRDRTPTRIPGGETMAEAAVRGRVALEGHGDPLRAAIAQTLGMRSTSCCGWRSPRLRSASRDDPKTA
jgi:hypothetical protein